MLKSYRSRSNAAKYIRERLQVTEQQVVEHVNNLTPEDILEAKQRQRAGIPAIAATGLLPGAAPIVAGAKRDGEESDVLPPGTWSNVEELDAWINSVLFDAIVSSRTRRDTERSSGHRPDHRSSVFVFPDGARGGQVLRAKGR